MKNLLFITLFFSSVSLSFQPTVTIKCYDENKSKGVKFIRIDENKKQLRFNLFEITSYEENKYDQIEAVIKSIDNKIILRKDLAYLLVSVFYNEKTDEYVGTNTYEFCEII